MANLTTFTWVAPTTNTDGSAVVAGEISGYIVGVRPSGSGSAGNYANTVNATGANTLSALIANVSPPISTGSYAAAVRSVGPTNSGWSAEITFTLGGSTSVPNPPSGLAVE
jgi:hypothetical protein